MTTAKKIRIRRFGVSPWHFFIENNLSWSFSVKKLGKGGQGYEDVLMADFLNILDFMPLSVIQRLFDKAHGDNKPKFNEPIEIKGNAGNCFLPDDEKTGIRLAQPDGWIADHNNLVLLEAKGYGNGAAFNPGQLAKEYLIAEDRADGRKFFVLLIVADKDKEPLKEFSSLFKEQCSEFKNSVKGKYNGFKEIVPSQAEKHFLWITWEEIRDCILEDDPCSKMLRNTINYHSNSEYEYVPIFSEMLKKLVHEPRCEFYNGGCGNSIVQKYEKEFSEKIDPDNKLGRKELWENWHSLAKQENDLLEKLRELDKQLLDAEKKMKDAKKKVKAFYTEHLRKKDNCSTTRWAFGTLCNYGNQSKDQFFTQENIEEQS